MPFVKLALKPGVFRNGTRYSAEGAWYDCDRVRFSDGFPEKIGGWDRYVPAKYLGSARILHDWTTITGSRYVGVGTTLKLYINEGSLYNDITPTRTVDTITLGADPIATVNNSGVITVTHTAHSISRGSYVTFSGATAPNGIPAASINKEHRVSTLVDADNYTILTDTQASSTGSGGGAAVVATPQVNTGTESFVSGSGWGAGAWSSGSWGVSASLDASSQLRLWSLDNYGDDLVAGVRLGGPYYWDQSNGVGTRAFHLHELTRRSVTLATATPFSVVNTDATVTVTDISHGAGVGDKVVFSGAADTGGIVAANLNGTRTVTTVPTDNTYTFEAGAAATSTTTGGGSAVAAVYEAGPYYCPVACLQMMVSNTARHVIAFGCNKVGGTTIDPLLVRWASSENAAEWNTEDETNTAGSLRISAGSGIVGALKTRLEHIIWTDVGVTSMRYIGTPFIFNFTDVGKNMSMVSQNAAIEGGGVVWFMDRDSFYSYSGVVKQLECPIDDYIFSDLDITQAAKVVASTIAQFSEVIWLYPSVDGTGENDSYVLHNWSEDVWTYGKIARGHWIEAPTKTKPLASSLNYIPLGTDPIAATSASSTVTVTQTAHGLLAADTVILSGSAAVGGLATNVLNTQHTVVTVPTVDTFTINVTDAASSTETGGGGAVNAYFGSVLFNQESGHDDDGSAMTAFIESADMDIGDGDEFWFIHRLVPDIQFRDSTDAADAVSVILKGHRYPGAAQATLSTSTVVPATEKSNIRTRTRQLAVRYESTGAGYGWRAGHTRLDGVPDGGQ